MKTKNFIIQTTAMHQAKQSGQIAVILVVFIGVLLAAFAVIVNLSKVSQQRTAMTVAVDTTTAFMASMYASYAEAQYQGVIEPGDNKEYEYPLTRKELAAWVAQAVALIIAIVGIVIAVCTAGAGTVVSAFLIIAVCSAVLSLAALVIELAYVNPQTQQMWNKMFKYMKTYDQFREQGAQALFASLVSDSVMIPDKHDYNQDGYYVGDGTAEGSASKVSRFSVLYTRRAEYLVRKNNVGILGDSDGIALYAWQDKIKPGDDPGSGKWHIVRSEVGVPMRCNKKCARTRCEAFGDHCPEPFLPWVKKWSSGINDYWSLIDAENKETGQRVTPCGDIGYKPVAYCFLGGLVMARANRYDEGGGAFNWATGLNFWNMKFRDIAPGSASPDDIEAKCGPIYQTNSGIEGQAASIDNGISYGIYDADSQSAALIINEGSAENQSCWVLLHQLLNQGMEARSCAEYFCRHGDEKYNQSRFGVKFVPCPPRW